MKKIERNRKILKIFILGVAYLMLLSIIPSSGSAYENTTAGYAKAAKSPDITNVRIVYGDGLNGLMDYKTKDYTCWTTGTPSYSKWNGTEYNDLNVVKNAGVVRRNTTFTVTGTGASDSTNITIKGPTDSGYRPTMNNSVWDVTYWEGEKWNLTIPTNSPVGDYQIYMDDEYCTLYVIFNVSETKESSGMTDLQFSTWAYNESSNSDADNYSCIIPGTGTIATGHPFEERMTELACSLMGSSTTTPYQGAIKLYRVVNARIDYTGDYGMYDAIDILNTAADSANGAQGATPLSISKAKKIALQTGETLPSDMVIGGECETYAVATTALGRSIGIPARVVDDDNGAGDCIWYAGWNFHTWTEFYIEEPNMSLAPSNSKWLFFDSTNQYKPSGDESEGQSAIDTQADVGWQAKFISTPPSNIEDLGSRYCTNPAAPTNTANWAYTYLIENYLPTLDDNNMSTIDLTSVDSGYFKGELGEGDRDFFRVKVSGSPPVDIGFIEGAEYAQIYVNNTTVGSSEPDFAPNSKLKTDYYNSLIFGNDKINDIGIGTGIDYLYIMIDNAKGDQYADDYWADNRAETHHYVLAVGKIPPEVTVLNPNGGETLVRKGVYTITWNTTDLNDAPEKLRANISYSLNSGETYPYYITPADNVSCDVCSYTWNVPDIETTTCRIKIIVNDTDGNKISDVSDANFSIKTSVPLNEITTGTGAVSNDRFGWNVSGAGDVNGDNINDIVVGAPFNDDGAADAGATYIFFGREGFNPNDLAAANADVSIYGTTANAHLGWSVAGAGEVNGDIYDDIIIGEPDTGNGNAYIFFGQAWGTPPYSYDTTSASVTLTGESAGDKFGCSVAGLGNVNNVDNDDIAVGAYMHNFGAGKVYIYYGDGNYASPDVTLNGSYALDTIFYETFPTAATPWDGAGQSESWSVVSCTDLQVSSAGFAATDSPSGAPWARWNDADNGFLTPESAEIFYASIDLSGYKNVEIEYYWQTDDVDAGEGFRCAYSTDSTNGVDGTWIQMYEHLDPVDDAWTKDGPYSLPGSACVSNFKLRFSAKFGAGPTENVGIDDIKITGVPPLENFGFSVSSAGNMNADDYDDVIVGAPGTANGNAYVFYGGPGLGAEGYDAGTTNLALTGVASASSVNAAGYEADKATDGDTGTTWASAGFPTVASPEWLKVDLGSVMDIKRIKLDFSALVDDNDPGDWLTQISTDDSLYTTVDTVVDYTGSEIYTYDFPTYGNARYVKIHITDTETSVSGNAVGIAELGVYEAIYSGTIANITFTGENPGDKFGWSVSSCDLNNDTASDVIIGAPGYENNRGKVYVKFADGLRIVNDTQAEFDTATTKENVYVTDAGDVNLTCTSTSGDFSDNMESGEGEWSHSAGSGTDDWGLVTTASHSATHSWFSSAAASVKDDYLFTPSMTLTSSSVLTFWHKYDMESGYDGCVIEISTSGMGGPWVDIGSLSSDPYDATISTGYSSPIGGRDAWTGTQGSFVQATLNIGTDYGGNTIIIRFRLACDSSGANTGWWVDDVSITNVLFVEYASSGSLVSVNTTSAFNIGSVEPVWDATLNGQHLEVKVSRDGGTTWSFESMVNGETYRFTNNEPAGNILKFNVTFTSLDTSKTPVLHKITIYYSTGANDIGLTGECTGDQFGYSVSGAGDMDSDGYDDLVVGAPFNQGNGSIYVFYGDAIMDAGADYINYGNSNENLGFSVCGLGDVNNDKYDDVGVGAPNTANGKAYVYSTQGGAAPDTEKPQISSVNDSPDPQETGGFVNITAIVTDNVGVDSVYVNISYPDGSYENFTITNNKTGNTYYCNKTYTILGTYTYFVWATDSSSNENASITYTFVIQDTTKPEITNVQDTPDPQEVNGWVNITVTVADVVLDKVKVNISGPVGFMPVNTTMTKISGTDGYYYNTTYTVKGTYSYFIWANDTANNENTSATYYFEIDNTPPGISNINDNPDPQEVGGYVNITVTVTDNMEVDSVFVNITDPNGDSVNMSMINVGGTDDYYYNTTYAILGDYSYFVLANDTSNNGNISSSNTFTIQDTTKPEISSVQANPDLQTSGGYVNISVIVTDNVGVSEVWLNISWNGGSSWTNFSITQNVTGNTYYCNQTYSTVDWYNYTVWANDTSNNWNNSNVYSFNITGALDTEPPQISIPPTAGPDPQEVNNWVNITIYVSDNVLVNSVKVNISYPNGTLLGNFSMTGISLDANGNGTYYYNTTYSEVGDYSYFIWAKDSSNNENATIDYTFTMQDTEKPGISSVQANPEEQETGGYVNISTVVTDNHEVNEVYLNITYPDGHSENLSITQNVTGSTYYCNKTYTTLGWYNYTIWANDSSNNWNYSAIYSFNITVAPDTELPEITSIQDTPDPQETGGWVNITVTVTDNVAVSEVFLNITYPDSSYENISITQNKTGDTYYCNKTYSMLGEYSYLIWANDTSSNGNKSSAFTFDIVTIDYIVIEDAPGGTGNLIGEKSYTVTNTDTYYAIGYNYSFGYVKDVSCIWSSNNTPVGTVSPAAGTSTTFTAVAVGTCYIRAENVTLGLSDITETITVTSAKVLKAAGNCEKNNNKVSDNNSPMPSFSLLMMFFVLPFGVVLSANTKGKFSKKMFIFVILTTLIFSAVSNLAVSETLTGKNTGGAKSPDTVTLYPNAEGTDTGVWTYVGGSGNYANLQTNDGDTTYVSSSTSNNVDHTVNLDDTALSGTINSVTAYVVGRAPGATEDHEVKVYVSGTAYASGSEFYPTASYATYSWVMANSPATGVAWTWAEVNSLQVGVETDVNADVLYYTQMYAVVDYTPAVVDNPPVVNAYEPGGTSSQTYNIGDIITVKWNVTDDNPMPADNINISYGNASVGWTSIITNTANDETHDWDTSLATPGIYYINISAYDSISQESYDLGNFTFELLAVVDNPPTVGAYEPGGTSGQTYNIGDIVTVKWNATDDNPMPADNINISYGNATAGWTTIITNTANDETEPWDTSTATPGIYYINISAYDSIGQETYDLGNFTFVLWKIDYIVIENSAGTAVGEMSFSASNTYNYYARGYNITYGYSKDVNCVWGSNNTAVGTVTSPGTFTTFTAAGPGKCYVRAENVTLGLSDITKTITVTGAANNPPNKPTGLGVQGFVSGAGLIHITDDTPVLNWTFTDPDGNDQGGYNVSVWNGSVGSGTLMWYKNATGSEKTVTYGDGGEPTTEPALGDGYCYNLSVEVNDTGGLWNTSDPLMFRMNTPPTAPTGPTNLGDYLTDHTPTVSWTAGADAELDTITYYVYVSTSPAPTTLEWSGAATICDLGNTVTLSDGTAYYWRVKANDSYEDSSFAPDDNGDPFRMNTPPTLSNAAVNPMSGTTLTTFTYNVTYSDAEGDAPTSMVVYILKGGNNISGSPFTMNWQSGSNTTGANYTYSTTFSTTGTDYTFYFNATDGTENATPTASTDAPDVSTSNNPPNSPTLTAPDNDTWTNNTPLFDWDFSDPNNDESRGYNVTISSSSAFSTVDYWVNKSTTENITKHLWGSGGESSSPIDDGTWCWRMKVKDVNGAWSDWSGWRIIKIDTVAPTVTISVSDTVISDADAGDTFWVNCSFSENMNDTVPPTISFSPDVVTLGTLTFVSGVWNANDDWYNVSYTIADVGENQVGVDVSVSGGQDDAGNPQTPDPTTEADKFDVDTVNPSVSSTDPNNGGTVNTLWYNVTVIFNENMNISVIPTVESNFASYNAPIWNTNTKLWVNQSAEYTNLATYWLNITGGRDESDNLMNYKNFSFTVDTTAVDTDPPDSYVNLLSGYWNTTGTATVTATATDATGVECVGLWYSYSNDNLSWGAMTFFELDTAGPWEWTFDFPQGEGWYNLSTNSTDTSSNHNDEPENLAGDVKCGYDAAPPSNPSANTSTPETGDWSNDNTIDVSWSGASDDLSGIAVYYYAWTTTSTYIPTELDNSTELTSNTSFPLSDNANWYLHIITKDNASNLNLTAYHVGPFKIDSTPPSNPNSNTSTSHTVGVWSSDNIVQVTWDGADGSISGIKEYYYCWSTDPETVPTLDNSTTLTTNTSLPLDDSSSWYLHIITIDNASNLNSTAYHIGPFRIDTTPPETILETSPSSPNGLNGWYNSSVTVYLNATDLAGVSKIYYRINGGWLNQWVEVDGNTSFTLAEDKADNYTIEYYAVDILGHEETEKENNTIKIDRTGPAIMITETPRRVPPFVVTAIVVESISDLNTTDSPRLYCRNKTSPWYSKKMDTTGKPNEYSLNTSFLPFTPPDGSEIYYYVEANDTAGNSKTTDEYIFKIDLSPITENNIRFSHYLGMVGQNITIYVDVYNNESVNVARWVNITANYGELNYNESISIGSEEWNSTSAIPCYYIIPSEADGKTITFTVRIYGSGEKDSETAEFEVASSFTGGRPVKSFDPSLPMLFIAAIFTALLSLKSKNKRRKQL